MTLPDVIFSNWLPWNDRRAIPGHDFQGVYLLGRFENKVPTMVSHTDENVIYIGESTRQCLRTRIKDFNRSAFLQKNGHSGGWTYYAQYADKGETLYVSGFPVKIEKDVLRTQFIYYLERKLILDFVLKWDRLPACNKK